MNVRPTFVEHTQTERPMSIPPASARGEWLVTALYRLAVAAALIITLSRILWHFSGRSILDDAYMFVRYADHLMTHGSLVWNVGGPPTYGLTAPAFLLVVLPVRLLFPESPGATVAISSAICGTIFLILLYILLRRHVGATERTRRMVNLLAAIALATGSYSLCNHFSTGMDTMMALATVTAIIIGHRRNEAHPTTRLTILLGVASGLAFFVRPDLMIYTVGAPGLAMLLARDGETRKRMAIVIGTAAVVLGIELLVTSSYFGLPLPLPFYAKGLRSYSGYILEFYRHMAQRQFVFFLGQYAPLFVVAIPSFFYLLRRNGLRAFTPYELGLWGATAVFITYYLFFVMQIMPQEARFYYPTVPALFFLGARSLVLLLETDAAPVRAARRVRAWLTRVGSERKGLVIGAAAGAALLGIAGAVVMRDAIGRSIERAGTIGDLDARAYYVANLRHYWYRLDEFSALPDDLVMGTTEVGMASALNPGKTIIDLAGLNDAEVVRHGFSTDVIFTRYNPDFFYMPHPHYTEMNRALLADPRFAARYDYFPARQLGTEMGVAIRKDSRYYDRLRAIALEGPVTPAPQTP